MRMQLATVSYKSIISSNKIVKPNYHLNYGKQRIEKAISKGFPFVPLGEAVKDVFSGGIFKRVFVENEKYGLAYISAQHMMHTNPKEISKLISKKFTPRQEDMTLKANQILISCAGTVGNARLIGKDMAGIVGSQDIIRVIPDDSIMPYGYVYAYLSSQTAYEYIQSFIYGSVVPRVEPKTLSQLPILVLDKKLQQKIHSLIVKASQLRDNANTLLQENIQLVEQRIESHYSLASFKKVGTRSIREIITHDKRMDAPFNSGPGRNIYDQILINDHITLKDIARVFHPILFGKKQIKGSANTGNPLYKSSSMVKQKPETDFWLSRKKINAYNKLQVKEGWVLISRTGTVGNVSRIGSVMHNSFIDDHMIRVEPKKGFEGLCYFYLKSSYGKKLIEFQKYGSVQEVINSEYIERIPISKFLTESDLSKQLNSAVRLYSQCMDDAYKKEAEAISCIENEIESWQE